MEAGVELDTYLGEKFMGWRDMRNGLLWSDQEKRTKMVWGSELHKGRIRIKIESDEITDDFIWAPSRNIQSAVKLLPRLRALGYSVQITVDEDAVVVELTEPVSEDQSETTLAEAPIENGELDGDDVQNAIALAISLAAWKAQERQERQERQEGKGQEGKGQEEPDPDRCRCGKPGQRRSDGGLAAGVHCDECWDDMIAECRRRSW